MPAMILDLVLCAAAIALFIFFGWQPLAVIAIIIGQYLDVWSTNLALSVGAKEGNPLMRWAMEKLGRWWWAIKIAPLALGVYLTWNTPGLAVLAVVASIYYGWIVFYRNLPEWEKRL